MRTKRASDADLRAVRDDVELARKAYDLLNRGEVDRFLTECVHPEYEFHTNVEVPSIPSVVRGHDELRVYPAVVLPGSLGQLQMEVQRIEELADGRVLALLTLGAKGRESGALVDTEYAHILTYRDGLGVRVDGFPTWRRALAAAGLPESGGAQG